MIKCVFPPVALDQIGANEWAQECHGQHFAGRRRRITITSVLETTERNAFKAWACQNFS